MIVGSIRPIDQEIVQAEFQENHRNREEELNHLLGSRELCQKRQCGKRFPHQLEIQDQQDHANQTDPADVEITPNRFVV